MELKLKPGWLTTDIDRALVSLAAGNPALHPTPEKKLPPRLWEALRIEMQRRYREATGEAHATLTVENRP